MESLGIALAAVAIVSLGTIAAFALKLVAAANVETHLRNQNYALQMADDQKRVALQDVERERNKAVAYAESMETELMALASVAGEPVVRAKLLEIWGGKIHPIGREIVRAVPDQPAAVAAPKPPGTAYVLTGGAVPDANEWSARNDPTKVARPGAVDIKRLGEMFKGKK